MPGKCRKSISEQLTICQRRIEGHINNPNSNPERYYRLLMREAALMHEVNSSQRNRGRSSRTPRKRD